MLIERRLNRRDPSSEDATARIPSQTIRIWLSPALSKKIEGESRAIRFDYQLKEVRAFEDAPPGRFQAARGP